MTHLPHATCLRLKELGFPQPQPASGQFWYGPKGGLLWLVLTDKHGPIFTQLGTTDHVNEYFDAMVGFVFCPSLEDITAQLPHGFILEMWDGRHSCKIDDWQNLIRTQADGFSEAAALVWLALNEKQTLAPNIIEARAASE